MLQLFNLISWFSYSFINLIYLKFQKNATKFIEEKDSEIGILRKENNHIIELKDDAVNGIEMRNLEIEKLQKELQMVND